MELYIKLKKYFIFINNSKKDKEGKGRDLEMVDSIITKRLRSNSKQSKNQTKIHIKNPNTSSLNDQSNNGLLFDQSQSLINISNININFNINGHNKTSQKEMESLITPREKTMTKNERPPIPPKAIIQKFTGKNSEHLELIEEKHSNNYNIFSNIDNIIELRELKSNKKLEKILNQSQQTLSALHSQSNIDIDANNKDLETNDKGNFEKI